MARDPAERALVVLDRAAATVKASEVNLEVARRARRAAILGAHVAGVTKAQLARHLGADEKFVRDAIVRAAAEKR